MGKKMRIGMLFMILAFFMVFRMPVAAEEPQPDNTKYKVEVIGGCAKDGFLNVITESVAGEQITIWADEPQEGYQFDHWNIEGYEFPEGVKDNWKPAIEMPAANVKFEAVYTEIPINTVNELSFIMETFREGKKVADLNAYTYLNAGWEVISTEVLYDGTPVTAIEANKAYTLRFGVKANPYNVFAEQPAFKINDVDMQGRFIADPTGDTTKYTVEFDIPPIEPLKDCIFQVNNINIGTSLSSISYTTSDKLDIEGGIEFIKGTSPDGEELDYYEPFEAGKSYLMHLRFKSKIVNGYLTTNSDITIQANFFKKIMTEYTKDNGKFFDYYALIEIPNFYKIDQELCLVFKDGGSVKDAAPGDVLEAVPIDDLGWVSPIPGTVFTYWEVEGMTLTEEQKTDRYMEFTMPDNPIKIKAVYLPDPNPVESFVKRMYDFILERDADEEGLKAWTDKLKNGEATGIEVAQGFILSEEFQNNDITDADYILRLYLTFMDRYPEDEGIEAWMSVIDSGLSRMHVFKGIAESPEFTNICANFGVERGNAVLTAPMDQNEDVTKFVARCYKVFLDRKGEEKGMNEWTNRLLTKEKNAKEVARDFVMSPEFQGLNLSNEEYLKTIYIGLLNRESDPAGLESWVKVLENGGTREEIFYGFADSPEFRDLARSYGLSGDWKEN